MQMPNYAQEIADSMNKYLTAGAAAQASQARLNNAVLNEISSIGPSGHEGAASAGGAGGMAALGMNRTGTHWYCLYFC
jgi:hypothetical protein